MLWMHIVPPAALQTAPVATLPIEALLKTLNGIPQAYIEGESGKIPGILNQTRAQWEQSKKDIAIAIPGHEVELINLSLNNMGALKPRDQAELALEVSAHLITHVSPTRETQVLGAASKTMLAWCRVDAGRWSEIPNVAEAFKPVVDEDQGRHLIAVKDIQVALDQLQVDLEQKSAPNAKKTLKRLLDLVAMLEKP